ncbi:DNA oxidative demethylase AlkB [Acidovorax sp. GBBC 3334]|uniref:DNA oxidative demethylase AlkB n=1 Tax=unclassified Acidovorax TaxID=2684926 RepID=UPI002303A127|nr:MULTISPECIES: DNA oxidative demethylase AlkB [unclassified Acidovorax]MDA8453626.1 DNA oxidative demethylase AlkB [Acidovorax sp. GBBC 3334]MDA8522378.1 DNA oxidative demethylase AlkB [Acidovorax sp. NCPPB 4044]
MTPDLFDSDDDHAPAERLPLGPGAALLRGFALPLAQALRSDVLAVAQSAPWRHMETPGGRAMSVGTTRCGALGWVSDRRGYRYARHDPATGAPWPAMPARFEQLARDAAAAAGFDGFRPDACLINRYAPGARLSLHQDRDERDLQAPIVSVSLGLGAVFLWGGFERAGPATRVALRHGDVVVWGGADRLRFHGVMPVPQGEHPDWGAARVNLTFRKAG